MTPRGVLAFCREKEVKAIDLRFTDLVGTWHHVTVPVSRLSEASFEHGFAVDTANFFATSSGDRLVIPQATSAFLDPFASVPTLILFGSLQDPITREEDPFDSRIVAERSINFLQGTGIADRARIATTCEFYLFNDVQIALSAWESAISVSPEKMSNHRMTQSGSLSSDSGSTLGSPRIDSSFDFRNAVMELLTDAEIPVSQHYPIGLIGGQAALEIEARDLVAASDSMIAAKFIVRSAAKRNGRLATFLPKPIESLRGSGMPLRFSLWRGEEPLFGGQGFGGLSELAMLAMGGILQHAPALAAFCNPTTNSYRRLHHSIEQTYCVGYSQEFQRTACRIPFSSSDPKAKCIEFRLPDGSANPYLAFSAILMAAIDGIQNKIQPGAPVSSEADLCALKKPLPSSLWDALDCLEHDWDFLLRGDVFSQEMLDRWLHYKRKIERPTVESHPTPAEYQQYFDC